LLIKRVKKKSNNTLFRTPIPNVTNNHQVVLKITCTDKQSIPVKCTFVQPAQRTSINFYIGVDCALAVAVTASFSTWQPGISPQSVPVIYLVDKVALGQIFSKYFGFSCQMPFHKTLHVCIIWAPSNEQIPVSAYPKNKNKQKKTSMLEKMLEHNHPEASS
jgi:hypothetical protein